MSEHSEAVLAGRPEAGREMRPQRVSREGQVLRRQLRLPRRGVLRREQRVLPHVGVLRGLLQVPHLRQVRARQQSLRRPVRLRWLRDSLRDENWIKCCITLVSGLCIGAKSLTAVILVVNQNSSCKISNFFTDSSDEADCLNVSNSN